MVKCWTMTITKYFGFYWVWRREEKPWNRGRWWLIGKFYRFSLEWLKTPRSHTRSEHFRQNESSCYASKYLLSLYYMPVSISRPVLRPEPTDQRSACPPMKKAVIAQQGYTVLVPPGLDQGTYGHLFRQPRRYAEYRDCSKTVEYKLTLIYRDSRHIYSGGIYGPPEPSLNKWSLHLSLLHSKMIIFAGPKRIVYKDTCSSWQTPPTIVSLVSMRNYHSGRGKWNHLHLQQKEDNKASITSWEPLMW